MTSASVWVRRHLPGLIHPRVRSYILRHCSLLDKRTQWWRSKDPYLHDPPHSTYESRYPVKLGIVKEFWHRHWPYIAACRELGVAFQVVDLTASDWLERFDASDCDAFLVYPSIQISLWKELYDERLRILVEEFGKTLFPRYDELWFYENKRRMAYWLQAHRIPHAATWVFYDKRSALHFAQTAQLPIVSKTSMGARASGVAIHRNRRRLAAYIRRAFSRGIVHADGEALDADWRFVILQEYLARVREWRVIRIGDCYFAHSKALKGEFHSGSGLVDWSVPSAELLTFVRQVTETGGFRSMCLDIFEQDGRFYVNELQAYFGWVRPYQMLVNGRPGCYRYEAAQGRWQFEEGIHCRNGGCNLRVAALLAQLGIRVEPVEYGHNSVADADRDDSIRSYRSHEARGQAPVELT